MKTRLMDSAHSGAVRTGQPAWRRFVAVVLIALISPIPALFAFWADASGDWLPDSWVDPLSGHVFTLSELNAFSDDIDGDGLSNAQEMAIGTNPFSPDTDGDGISDLLDPLPLSASNLSPANGIVWGAIALADADGDGTPNFLDEFPYGLSDIQVGSPDTDGDGIPDFIDPAPEDPYNTSPFNGLQWLGDALADADGDGVPNFHDWYPYDASLWDPMQDPDGDGFVKAKDPHPADPYNPSPVNGLNWGPDVYGDSDGDGIPNFYDAYPYDSGNGYVPPEPDSDGDGIPDSSDPSPWDYYNYSAANGVIWQADACGDADGDGISNFYDQFPYDYYNGNVPVSDMDGDGIPDAEDPAPTDPTNLSPINGGLWYTAALADADGDGNPNFSDPWPYDPTNGNLPPEWNSPTADTDGDGIANAQDPALADPLNFSIYNGTSWYGAAVGDADNDGIPNFRDEHPYDYDGGSYAGPDSDGDGIPDVSDPYPNDPNNGNGDADGDGIPDSQDPAQADQNNLSPFNGIEWFGDVRGDADGDGILNFWDLEPYGPTPVDTDGDGLIDSIDPAPTDPYNFSAYNKTSWSSDALGDADGDGIPNYFDTWPYDSLNGTGDADMDGLPDASDPVPADPYNNSPYNGAMWSGPSALGDVDNDGILNYFDAYPDDPYNGLPPGGDADGDGIPNEQDPDPRNGTNTSPYNGINWGEGANGDADGDGTANYWDYSPYGDDLDGDGIRDSDDPAPNDATNTSWINGRAWYGEALNDNDLDNLVNFSDPTPDGGMPYEPYLGELPSASASQLVLLNDGYEELGEAPAPGVTPARDLDNPELAIKAGSRAGKMAISRLTALNLSLPADYVNAGGSVTFTQSGAGFVRLHAVRMVDGEGVEGREISMGVPYVPPNDGTWVHLIESVRGGGVTLTCHFPWMLYGEITSEHPSGVMSSDVDVDLVLLPAGLILDNNNIAYKPDSEALGVSNYVTNNELPATSQFDDTNPDPENFRLQARLPNSTTNSVQMKLEVKRYGSVITTHNYTLDKKDGDFVRGQFLRLVTDCEDDAVSGDQTILVKLGDEIKVSYDIAAGSKVEQQIQVGRPSSEDNNEADKPWKHDIRKLKLSVHVFKNAAGAPCVSAAQIDQLVDEVNERFAQAGIKAEAAKDFGGGNAGHDRPQSLQDGYDGSPSVLLLPTADERACANLKDGDANTIDVIVVESMNTNGGRGTSFPKVRNGTGDAKYDNWMVLSSGVVGNFPNTFPHELMHILLNSAHRGDPATALFKGGTSPNKDVGGTKRIGPYPDATAAGVGQTDTTTMRASTETLP